MSEETSLDSPESQRFRTTLDMFEAGCRVYWRRMKREHPHATKKELDALVQAWLLNKPEHWPEEYFTVRDPSGFASHE